MNFEEHAAKPILGSVGIRVPKSELAFSPDEVIAAAMAIGPCVIKAQVPVGGRGKAGGIQIANTTEEAKLHAQKILGMTIGGYRVDKILVEAKTDIIAELYAGILNDPETKGPIILFSTEGGMDIEEIAENMPYKLGRYPIDIRHGITKEAASRFLDEFGLDDCQGPVAETLVRLFEAYIKNDAELLEINPLAITDTGDVVALDCKFVMDDSAVKRQPDLAAQGAPDKLTELEMVGESHRIKYIELDGNVVVLANGAGLTMTTMDVVRHYGGRPANFCEIGGEAYTKGKAALEMVLGKPGIKSLVVNFCGAFARCDVMMAGLLEAWEEIQPDIPVYFSIAGTGDDEAITMLKERLGIDPLPNMDEACKAAVNAANSKIHEADM